MQAVIENNLKNISALCREHHIKKLYVFGSAVDGGFKDDSDIDFLYEMDYRGFDFNNLDQNPYDPFLVFFDLKEKLEKLLGTKVDLIPNQNFRNKYLKESIEKSKTEIYDTSYN